MKLAQSLYVLRKLRERALDEQDPQCAQALGIAVQAIEQQHTECKQQRAAMVQCIPVLKAKGPAINHKPDQANITARLARHA